MGGAKTKTVRFFSWAEVKPAVIRAMLESHYTEGGRIDQVGRVAKLGDGALRENAEKRFGSPPKPRFFTRGMVETLRTRWLPHAQASYVDQLAWSMLTSSSLVGTKADKVSELQRRRVTKKFTAEFRDAFVRSHRGTREIEVTTTTAAQRPGYTG